VKSGEVQYVDSGDNTRLGVGAFVGEVERVL
jgi:hypothetical protein